MPDLAVLLILDRLGNDFLEAATWMVSPVDGLRPSRAGDSLILTGRNCSAKLLRPLLRHR